MTIRKTRESKTTRKAAKPRKRPVRKATRRVARKNARKRAPSFDPIDFNLQYELEEGVVIQDRRGGGYQARYLGKAIPGVSGSWVQTVRGARAWMKKEGYFPNLFYINERGNTDLLSAGGKTIHSWV
jgi:hypothetical protein